MGQRPSIVGEAAKLFVPVWLDLSIANLWIGVSRAGYTVGEEVPILLIVFAVPAALAAVAVWRSTWAR